MKKQGMTLILPYPPHALSPNARVHWSERSRYAKRYLRECFVVAYNAGLNAPSGRILLGLEFYPPSNRRRDDDNLIASFKAGRDGLALAMGIDDHVFVSAARICQPAPPRGYVRATLSALDE